MVFINHIEDVATQQQSTSGRAVSRLEVSAGVRTMLASQHTNVSSFALFMPFVMPWIKLRYKLAAIHAGGAPAGGGPENSRSTRQEAGLVIFVEAADPSPQAALTAGSIPHQMLRNLNKCVYQTSLCPDRTATT